MAAPVEIFCCYSRKDHQLLLDLKAHLIPLQRQGLIKLWADTDISAGTEWEKQINTYLNTAQIILLLVSPDFMNSDYCYSKEMTRAIERHEQGEARVLPIIVRPVYWKGAPFGKLQVLPTEAKPILSSSWHYQDEAFFDVVEGVYRAIQDRQAQKTKEQWLEEADRFLERKQYSEALAAYEQAIRLDPNRAPAYYGKGDALYRLKRYQEALEAYEQAIRLDPNDAGTYNGKGDALYRLKRYQEALEAYEQAIRLDPNDAGTYNGKGNALGDLKRYQEALEAYEQAIRLDPNDAYSYKDKSYVLDKLNRKKEAQQAYEKARQLGYPGWVKQIFHH